MDKLIDGGAPQISLAQAEFEKAAIYWQEKAKLASDNAIYYTSLATAMHNVYQYQIAKSIEEYKK